MPVKHALVGKGKGLIEDYDFASSLQMRERAREREREREKMRERERERERDGEKKERDIVSCRLTLQLGFSILGGRVLTYADVCTLTHADSQLTANPRKIENKKRRPHIILVRCLVHVLACVQEGVSIRQCLLRVLPQRSNA